MGYTAGNLDGGTASGRLEIGRVDLRFAAACRGPAPFGAILVSTPFSLSVNRRSAVQPNPPPGEPPHRRGITQYHPIHTDAYAR
eukprot:COSAG02_NODE_3738_length_6304_cov_14.777438_3_plen_84_part_00